MSAVPAVGSLDPQVRVRPVRLGTRASHLARTQSTWVADRLRGLGVDVALNEISTQGDRSSEPLSQLGGTGVFVSALREALLAGEVDLAVHSLKDLPTASAAGIALAAVPVREDSRDALVARDGLTLGELPPGSTVGTGSPRRAAQIRALGLGVEIVDIRGNVDTRLRKVRDGELDAVVLARAGLARIGRLEEITEVLDPIQVLPAPGQGALAIECRADDAELLGVLRLLEDPAARATADAERALLARLEAGCSAPVGAMAEVVDGDDGDEVWLRATVFSLDGALSVRLSDSGPLGDASGVGTRLAERMLDEGAADLMEPPMRKQQA